eukprot:1071893-Pyramimonas_sp.AAC.1
MVGRQRRGSNGRCPKSSLSCDGPPGSSTRRSQPLSSREPAVSVGQTKPPAAAAMPVAHGAKELKRKSTAERRAHFKWSWREISDEPWPPAGVVICVYFEVANRGLRQPTVGATSDPKKRANCVREFRSRGGGGGAKALLRPAQRVQATSGMLPEVGEGNAGGDREARG